MMGGIMTTVKSYKEQQKLSSFDPICPICKRPESECYEVWKRI